ncbi:MAG: GTP cyclohydrolase IIa [Nitrososphaerales archaeon]
MSGKLKITLIRIDNYSPWTLELGNDREYQLQIIQAQLYAHLQRLFAEKGGALFYNRFDEMIAISNGISLEDHLKIQDEVSKNYPFTISMGIGLAEKPYDALERATKALQIYGSNTRDVKKVVGEFDESYEKSVKIAHIDVNNVTDKLIDRVSAYETALMINRLNLKLSELFLKHKALTFFCGGDNFIVVANGVSEKEVKKILTEAGKGFNLTLKAGIGIAKNARKAIELATKGLDFIRIGKANSPVHEISDFS